MSLTQSSVLSTFVSLLFVAHARTARRVEDAEQTEFGVACVLDAVNLMLRKVDARTRADLRARLAGPHTSLAAQYEQDFFVSVKMVGRAPRRDRADELRDLLASDLLVNQHAIPAVGRGHGLAFGEAHDRHARVRRVLRDGRRERLDRLRFFGRLRALRTYEDERS